MEPWQPTEDILYPHDKICEEYWLNDRWIEVQAKSLRVRLEYLITQRQRHRLGDVKAPESHSTWFNPLSKNRSPHHEDAPVIFRFNSRTLYIKTPRRSPISRRSGLYLPPFRHPLKVESLNSIAGMGQCCLGDYFIIGKSAWASRRHSPCRPLLNVMSPSPRFH
ncbi:hypothetical protein BDV19DRAFT_336943 [Aspergillus venezuelensis]